MKRIKNNIISVKNWAWSGSWKKKLLVIGIVLALIWFISSRFRSQGNQYTTEKVTRGTISDIVSETGNVASSGRFDVYSTSTGYIEEVYVQNGTAVKAGDRLFKVKSTATDQEKATAYASYMNALATKNTSEENKPLYQSQLEAARQKVIDASNAVNAMNDNRNNGRNNQSTHKAYTQEEIDSINSELISARQSFTSLEKKYLDSDTNIQAGRAGLSSAWYAYKATLDSVVTAIAPGTVANFSANVGDKVTAFSATSTSSPALVILGDVSRAIIKIPLNEVDVNKVHDNQTATIVFDAFREKKYIGHIATIDSAGTNTNGVITYNAAVVIDNPDANIRTEMTATVSIETAKREHVLTVSNSAIKPYKGGKAVIVLGADKDTQVKNKAGIKLPLHYIPVKTGLKGISRTEIIQGVSEGTQVVTSSIN